MAGTTLFKVGSESALDTAISSIDVGGKNAAANTAYTIDITGPIALTANLTALDLMSGSSVAIAGTDGNGGVAVQTMTATA